VRDLDVEDGPSDDEGGARAGRGPIMRHARSVLLSALRWMWSRAQHRGAVQTAVHAAIRSVSLQVLHALALVPYDVASLMMHAACDPVTVASKPTCDQRLRNLAQQ